MFGYVRPLQGELLVREHAMYRAYYCGVCKGLGKQCGPLCRMFLQFDFAMLALALDETLEDGAQIQSARCSVNPLSKLPVATGQSIEYCSDAHGILLHGKAIDAKADKEASMLLYPFTKAMTKKAARRQTELSVAMDKMLHDQAQAEKSKADIDQSSQPFALFCQSMFTPPWLSPPHANAMGWLGYNLGKWIYFVDGLEDYDRDKKKQSFNPWHVYGEREEAVSKALPLLHQCADQALAAWDVLPERRNYNIVHNILEQGLFDMAQKVAYNRSKKEDYFDYQTGS